MKLDAREIEFIRFSIPTTFMVKTLLHLWLVPGGWFFSITFTLRITFMVDFYNIYG